MATGDFNHDGKQDLAVVSRIDFSDLNKVVQDVFLLLGDGKGGFKATEPVALDGPPEGLAAGDFFGDGTTSLAVTTFGPLADDTLEGRISVFRVSADGSFSDPVRRDLGPIDGSTPLVAGDFNGDGLPDLAAVGSINDDVVLFKHMGGGTFAPWKEVRAGVDVSGLVVGDFNGDGHADLAAVNVISSDVSVLLGRGDGTFVPAGTLTNTIHSTPLLADWNGDGMPDVIMLNRQGEILFRRGRRGEPGVYEPPVVINPDPRWAARDLTFVVTPAGLRLASLDTRNSMISLYATGPDGAFTRSRGHGGAGPLARASRLGRPQRRRPR